jgi:hypothetical protein
MFELIVLGLILLGLTLIARRPTEKPRTEDPAEPPPAFWSTRTAWQGLERPTYLRRGIVLDRSKRLPSCHRDGRPPSAQDSTGSAGEDHNAAPSRHSSSPS